MAGFMEKNEKIILAVIILIYLILEIINISLPGLYVDEAFSGCIGLQILKNIGPFAYYSVKLFGRCLPIMQGAEYSGAMEGYILSPFLWLFGANVVVLRLVPIIMQAGFLIALYFLLKDFFNRKVAFASIIFLTISSVFLLETKLGLNSASMLHLAAILVLCSLFKWYRGSNRVYFYVVLFILGLGISIRVWFLWFVNSLIILFLIFHKKILSKIRNSPARYLFFGLLSFTSGLALFVIYNFKVKGNTVNYITEHFFKTKFSINNGLYFENLSSRMEFFINYLNGLHPLMMQGVAREQIAVNQLYPFLFFGSLFWLAFSFFSGKSSFSRGKVSFVVLLLCLVILQSPFTLSSLNGPHLFIIFPLLPVILALAWMDIIEVFKKNRVIVVIINIVVAVFVVAECNATVRNNYLYFNKTGGAGNYTDTVYELVDYLKQNELFSPCVMDWGIYHNLVFLSAGKIIPRQFGYIEGGESDKKNSFIEECKLTLNKNANLYIFHSPVFTNRPQIYRIFEKIVLDSGRSLIEEKKFYQRNGMAVYILYSIK
ncbi:MAG: glycosyltransferase family 39 protein [Candidatus Omnitrophica bacterium]|nr:glycosyltransferase family 39 protein [Candidatus Omnitrophota bacterium]